MMSDDPESPISPVDQIKVSQGRHRCIVLGLLFISACAIAAIVLPLVLEEDCNCTTNREISTAQPTRAPIGPTSSPFPTPAPSEGGEPTKSPAPTATVTSLRLGQLINQYLEPISGEEVFEDPTSPQYRAAEFIADVDTVSATLNTTDQIGDRYALSTFYYATDGDNSWSKCFQADKNCTTGNSWMDPAVNHCEWSSIRCNDQGRVVDLFFASSEGNGLVGSIPPEISLLTELENLVAVNNLIEGEFPDTFGDLTNMRRIVLARNIMAGTIPEGFMQNAPLEILILSSNRFSGTIPTSLGAIPTMTQLLLGNNRFEGSIPVELTDLELLGSIELSKNDRLNGTIPDEIFGMVNLENLLLDGCKGIQGEIGSRIGGLTSLSVLRLGGTGMRGTIPDELFTLTNLSELDLTAGRFSGPLSENFSFLAPTLRTLKLGNNTFTGDIPVAFDSLTVLNVLELAGNDLTGEISSTICAHRGETRSDLNNLTADCDEVTCDCCTNCRT